MVAHMLKVFSTFWVNFRVWREGPSSARGRPVFPAFAGKTPSLSPLNGLDGLCVRSLHVSVPGSEVRNWAFRSLALLF